jgi:LysR family transcriptional repressor of citA
LEIEQLRTFVTLARNKSFSKTADALHLVQSTVSSRIQALETTVGKQLFIRDKRRVELTSAGRALLPYAERILLLSQESISKLRSLELYEDQLTIGATDSIWRYLLQPVMEHFFTQHLHVSLTTKTGHSWDVIHYLIDGVVQLGFVYLPQPIPGFEIIPFYEEEIILVAHPEHESAKQGVISPDYLAKIPLLYIDWGSPFHEWIRDLLPPDYIPQLHMDNLSLCLSFLRKNIGMGFMIRSAVQNELTTGQLQEIKLIDGLIPPKRQVFMMVRRDHMGRPAIQRWMDIMKAHGFFTSL